MTLMQKKERFHECRLSWGYSRKVSVFQQNIRRLKARNEETMETKHTWEVINSLMEHPLKPQRAAASNVFSPRRLWLRRAWRGAWAVPNVGKRILWSWTHGQHPARGHNADCPRWAKPSTSSWHRLEHTCLF